MDPYQDNSKYGNSDEEVQFKTPSTTKKTSSELSDISTLPNSHKTVIKKVAKELETAKWNELSNACKQWEKGCTQLHIELEKDSKSAIKHHRHNLRQCMIEVDKAYNEFQDTCGYSIELSAQYEEAKTKHQEAMLAASKRLEQIREGSIVSGISRLTKRSSSSSVKKMDELAKAKELQVKLKYMEQEHKLIQKQEKLKREKDLLETKIAMETAIARASAYDEEESETSDDNSSIHDRVQEYVNAQDPNIDSPMKPDDDSVQVVQIANVSEASERPVRLGFDRPKQVLNPHACSFIPSKQEQCQNPPSSSNQESEIAQLAKAFSDQMYASRLPAAEPNVFSGDPVQFTSWLTSFQLLIERRQITAAERLQYLRKYLGGQARECIEGFVLIATDNAYEEAKSLLIERYGNPFNIANAFRRKLNEWPRVGNRDNDALQKFADFLRQCEAAMRGNTYLQVLNDCQENRNMLRKLPEWMINRWSRHVAEHLERNRSYPIFTDFCQFIIKEARISNNPVTNFHHMKHNNYMDHKDVTGKRHVGATQTSSGSYLTNTDTNTNKETTSKTNAKWRKCVVCQKEHQLNDCSEFLKKSLTERSEYVKQQKLCFSCLKSNHFSNKCRNKLICQACGKRHPTSLHDPSWIPKQKKPPMEKAEVAQVQSQGQSSNTSAIVPVFVSTCSNPNEEKLVYAMLDTQSDTSFITESVCTQLQVDGPKTEIILSTLSQNHIVESKKIDNVMVRGYYSTEKIALPQLYTTKEVPSSVEHIPHRHTASKWSHLHHLQEDLPPLLDIEFGLLIGYNCSQVLIPRDVITSSTDREAPFAQRTDLGWCIIGPTGINKNEGSSSVVLRTKVKEVFRASEFQHAFDVGFDLLEEKPRSYNDSKFIDIMERSIKEKDGKYEMPLPINNRNIALPDNRGMAMKRLDQLKRKFCNDSVYQRKYTEFMEDVIEKGYAEMVPEPKVEGSSWYVPHHGVQHPKKQKVRVVFDCSARYQGVSLNDVLLQGPDLANDLVGILCRFRMEHVAICCDIQQMFYQFQVTPSDRDFLRFLWWPNGDIKNDPVSYRMAVHLFGAVSSPAVANFGLKRAADDGEIEFGTKAANFVRNNFYVDDGITSVPTIDEGKKLIKDTVALCKNKGLHLHKFISNLPEVLSEVDLKEISCDTNSLKLNPEQRALGLEWNIKSDAFQFPASLKTGAETRRGMLSSAYSLYDPLGLISPIALVGRQLLQEVCKQGFNWDDPLPNEITVRWRKWCQDLENLKQLQIPRCYKPKDFGPSVQSEIHTFSDASTLGYGQCSYLRLVNQEGKVCCSLILSKSRVAPLKQITIPRAELAAATLAVRISRMLKKQLPYQNLTEHFYTDSKVVLGYLQNDAKRFHTYVANRVQLIRDNSEIAQWSHIGTKENPADLTSRGTTVNQLMESCWFKGPTFLWQTCINQPALDKVKVDENDPEVKKRVMVTKVKPLFDLERFSYFSSWYRLKRAVALCLKYKEILRAAIKGKTKPGTQLSVEDLQQAERCIIQLIQTQDFADELSTFQKPSRLTKRTLKRKHTLYKLDPFVDEQGILRVGGRIIASSLAQEVKQPVVLARHSHIARLIAIHCHNKVSHQGRTMTMNMVRLSGYWIMGCRNLISSIINSCVKCQKNRGTVLDQKMSNLPEDRVEPSPPFTFCAVDYFGPFYIKEKRSELKRFGVLFTCMSSRAIHVETANSMDTDSFLNALRRFIAIRGPIRQLRCDMGTNFVGAQRELTRNIEELNVQQIQAYLKKHGADYFDFKMNVPGASHMGGVWERQIRTVRSVLTALLNNSGKQLDDESLRTFMYEAMAIVNSRPITVQNLSDVTSPEPLTPNHLLHMKSQVVLPPPSEFQSADIYSRHRWRRVQHLLNEFWNRWRMEYLQNLQPRQKWNETKVNIAVGDIVLVKDSNLPRCKWLLGRVEETISSADKEIRKVKLRIATKEMENSGKRVGQVSFLERPIQKLVLICRSPSPTESQTKA